jgi:hypothetical protein
MLILRVYQPMNVLEFPWICHCITLYVTSTNVTTKKVVIVWHMVVTLSTYKHESMCPMFFKPR